MNKVTIKACPLCGGTQLEHTLTCVDHYASGEAFHLCRCSACGFLFTQDFPAEAEIGRYYWVRTVMLGRKARLVMNEAHRRRGRLLDIGTGTGYFAHAMDERGWRVDVIEKNAQARAFAKEHFGLEVLPDDAWASLQEGAYDVITLWHVMEHLEHLNDTWERLYRLLSPKGVLIVAVPNCSSFDAHKYGGQWAAYDVPRHLWHFTPGTMQQFGAKHGFILAERHPMPFDAFYVSMLTEKYMHHNLPFVRGLLTGTLAWFSALVRKDRSSSLIYVFRKKQSR